MIFTVPDTPSKTGKPRAHIVLLMKRGKARSKYYDLTCFCGRKRKDGSCKHTDIVLSTGIRPEYRARVQVTQPLLKAAA